MIELEARIRELTMPINGQYPRPWMTDMRHPGQACVFIVGRNQATACRSDVIANHDAYIDVLFNRNGYTCRKLYTQMRENRGPSPTRRNLDALVSRLAEQGINDVLETNVICYATPMSSDLAHQKHTGGRQRGTEIFLVLLAVIRPPVLIAHGVGTCRDLERLLNIVLPGPPSAQEDEVSHTAVNVMLEGTLYAPTIIVLPSLAPPGWNRWARWALPHLKEVGEYVATLLAE